MSQQNTGPLKGIRIIDLTTVLLGPYATQILGDLGADVIKVEGLTGDLMRTAGPSPSGDMGPIYTAANRNKRSLVLDLREETAKEALRKLVATADAFITNIRGGGIERLGFGYDDVRKMKEDIVYVHCVGFGSDGPYAGRQAYDDLVQGASGIADLLPKTERGGAPRFLPSLVADKATGLHAVYATIAALFHKERTGEGQFVEVPMLEALTSFNLAEHFYGHIFEPSLGQWGYTRVLTPNRRPHPTKDGYIGIVPYTDKHWPLFFEIAGKPELWDEWRGMSFEDRTKRIDELYGLIGTVTREKTTDEWMALLNEADIPCMRINRLDDLMDDPHLKETGFFTQMEHPTEGTYYQTKHPVKFTGSPAAFRRHPPRFGADGGEILSELGYSEADVKALIDAGVVGQPKPVKAKDAAD